MPLPITAVHGATREGRGEEERKRKGKGKEKERKGILPPARRIPQVACTGAGELRRHRRSQLVSQTMRRSVAAREDERATNRPPLSRTE